MLFADAGPVGLWAGGSLVVEAAMTTTKITNAQVNSSFSQTCASNGTGAAGSLTIVVAGVSNVEVTNADPNGCGVTLAEPGARGQVLTVINVSNAGGTLDFVDSSGVQETGAGCSLAIHGAAVFRYITDRWIMVSCQPVN
jgi:hypothetical protein